MKRIESTVEREEEELGGFVRNHRPTGPPREEKPNGRKKPRHSRVLLQNLVPPDEPEVAHTGVVKPPEEKKEVKEMTNNVTPVKEKKIPFPIPGFVMCPACGQYSKHIVLNGQPYIVCIGCDNKYYAYRKDCDEKYRVYADQVAAEIAAGKNPVVQPKVASGPARHRVHRKRASRRTPHDGGPQQAVSKARRTDCGKSPGQGRRQNLLPGSARVAQETVWKGDH